MMYGVDPTPSNLPPNRKKKRFRGRLTHVAAQNMDGA